MKAVIGKKIGMTQVFMPDGKAQPVTVIEAGPCVVLQRKKTASDGYSAIQLGFDDLKKNHTNKPLQGHIKKAKLTTGKRYISEVRVSEDLAVEPGMIINSSVFDIDEVVSVTGYSIGRGFQGAIKRHGYTIGPKTHGSKQHRYPGTLGAGTGKSNVLKGKKLPGHMGDKKVTMPGLKVIDVIPEKNVILIGGSIPGAKNSYVIIKNRNEYDLTKLQQSESSTSQVVAQEAAKVSDIEAKQDDTVAVAEEAKKEDIK